MRYLKNSETNEIIEGQAFGSLFDNWIELTESEILAYKLQEAKTAKISEVKNACRTFRTLPLTVGGKTYKTTDNAKSKFWIKVNGSLTGDFPITWLESDNISFVSLTKIQASAVYDAFEAQDLSAYQQRGVYFNQINACTTLEQLNAININFE